MLSSRAEEKDKNIQMKNQKKTKKVFYAPAIWLVDEKNRPLKCGIPRIIPKKDWRNFKKLGNSKKKKNPGTQKMLT